VAALVALLTVGGDTLGERLGPPVEELAVERTVLRPGEIELTVRNTDQKPWSSRRCVPGQGNGTVWRVGSGASDGVRGAV
jgi:hypothetical protein